jgi:hypothetical protein
MRRSTPGFSGFPTSWLSARFLQTPRTARFTCRRDFRSKNCRGGGVAKDSCGFRSSWELRVPKTPGCSAKSRSLAASRARQRAGGKKKRGTPFGMTGGFRFRRAAESRPQSLTSGAEAHLACSILRRGQRPARPCQAFTRTLAGDYYFAEGITSFSTTGTGSGPSSRTRSWNLSRLKFLPAAA